LVEIKEDQSHDRKGVGTAVLSWLGMSERSTGCKMKKDGIEKEIKKSKL
jgi:hypothetical protein